MVMNIGIIGGTGWMGKIMADALLAHLIPPEQLWISNHSGVNNFSAPIQFTVDPQKLIDAVDVVIVAVRPIQFMPLSLCLENKLVISIMARITLATLSTHTGAERIIRAMPNAAIPEGLSYTPWCVSAQVTQEDKKIAQSIFDCFGTEDEVLNEDVLNFMTALTGASHGWLAYVANSLIDCALDYGLDQSVAERAIRQVMKGVGQLIAHEKPNPQETLELLSSYGGQTITEAGLHSFAQDHMDEIIKRAIRAAYDKASIVVPRL